MAIDRYFEHLIYQTVRGHGFTQHSPLMPDVWLALGRRPAARHELLLSPRWENTAEQLADAVRVQLGLGDGCHPLDRDAVGIANNRGIVAARLDFEQVLALLPLTGWWRDYLVAGSDAPTRTVEFLSTLSTEPSLRATVAAGLADGSWPGSQATALRPTSHLWWLIRVAGTLAWLRERLRSSGAVRVEQGDVDAVSKAGPEQLVAAFVAAVTPVLGLPAPSSPSLWSIDHNRRADAAIYKSTLTVKADAARHLFEVRGKGISWAIVDSGIDATHLAFRKRDAHGRISAEAFEHVGSGCEVETCSDPRHWRNNTRIKATYDFRQLRELLALEPATVEYVLSKQPPPAGREQQHLELHDRWQRLCLAYPWLQEPSQRAELFELIHQRRHNHGSFEWSRWAPLLAVPHDRRYRQHIPADQHGTHVAGILAADWQPDDRETDIVKPHPDSPFRGGRVGVCPEIEVFDLRVLGADEVLGCASEGQQRASSGNEFAVLSALEFVRHFNARYAHLEIHGVNLSLALPHKVASYACGRTPVCNECERLSADGVVVVAAAGNNGRAVYQSVDDGYEEGYRNSSITDPGNAESVITVGATHRSSPHVYGISYFSSRGPTGDGRFKPDLVAPGEKIVSTRPHDGEISLDGTSMAAPHVSGAAALLMCRHEELRGRPQEIKRILCATATDLARERYYQGAGLVDILRALQAN